MPLKLETTGDELSSIWAALDKIRAHAQVVKVDPNTLRKILLDHGKILKRLQELGE
jgi:hypothetical protein